MTHRTSIDWNEYRKIALLRDSGHPDEALVKFQHVEGACSDDEERAPVLLDESLCYRELGRFAEAVEAASAAVQLLPPQSPIRPFAEFSLACAHRLAGDLDRAAQELRALLRNYADILRTDNYISMRRDAERWLATTLISLGIAIEPLSLLDKLKEEAVKPEEIAELQFREAQANGLLGRQDHALELYQQALAGPLASTLIARAHFAVGETLFNRREFACALTEFEDAARAAEKDTADHTAIMNWLHATREALHKT